MSTISLVFAFVLLFPSSLALQEHKFMRCLVSHSSNSIIHTRTNYSSFTKTLNYSLQNPRFSSKTTPKPLVIITPRRHYHIKAAISCCKKYRIQLRTRCGGHDYEGLSYASYNKNVPFIILDLLYLRSVIIDVERRTAWVESGATIGEVYHKIAEKSRMLGFPAGVCTTMGSGGHFSGGGYGMLLRKYGMSADNVVDARLIDVDGRFMDREGMGEDVFWAIRGGGGTSFGVVVEWKIMLVPVPYIVTVFSVDRNLEQKATHLVHRWQYVAHRLHEDLFIRIIIGRTNGTIKVTFDSLFLGSAHRLVRLMRMEFPELGLTQLDCDEMSWIDSVLSKAGFPTGDTAILLNRTPKSRPSFKAKSDYVRIPISEKGFQELWKLFFKNGGWMGMILTPYGGIMDRISESSIPYPHRRGNLYKIQYLANWEEDGEKYMEWIRLVYEYMTEFVTKNPRAAYVNYRDLDVGMNKGARPANYREARVWGMKYFGKNFERLVQVKSKVDPHDFFWNEQSIPSLFSKRTKEV